MTTVMSWQSLTLKAITRNQRTIKAPKETLHLNKNKWLPMTIRKVCYHFSKTSLFLLKSSLSNLSFGGAFPKNSFGHSFVQVRPPSTSWELAKLHSCWSRTNISIVCGKMNTKATKTWWLIRLLITTQKVLFYTFNSISFKHFCVVILHLYSNWHVKDLAMTSNHICG